MIAPEQEDLVQRGLDQQLTADEQARLRVLLSRDAAVREVHQRLRATVGDLEQAGAVEPPGDLAAAVMRDIADRAPARRTHPGPRPRPALADSARRVSRRRVLWGMAAAAGLILGGTWLIGIPSVDLGTQGTIGTARAQNDQLARAFLASETFGALRADTRSRELLTDPLFRGLLTDEACRAVLADPPLAAALTHPSFLAALADASFRAAVAAGTPSARASSLDSTVLAALDHPVFAQAVASQPFQAAAASPGFRGLLRDPLRVSVLGTPEFRAAMTDARLPIALASPQFDAALR